VSDDRNSQDPGSMPAAASSRPRLTRRTFVGRAAAAGLGAAILAAGDPALLHAAHSSIGTSSPFGENPPSDPITWRVLNDDSVVWAVQGNALVMALKDQLLVRASALPVLNSVAVGLADYARPVIDAKRLQPIGLIESFGNPPMPLSGENARIPVPYQALGAFNHFVAGGDDVLLYQTVNGYNSIQAANALNASFASAGGSLRPVPGAAIPPPAVSPNHVFVPCASFDSCPGGPPSPPAAVPANFIPARAGARVQVVALDSGFIPGLFRSLDAITTPATGYFCDVTALASGAPPSGTWSKCPPDAAPIYRNGHNPMGAVTALMQNSTGLVQPHTLVLDGVAGHGTFVAGLIANHCAAAEITVVGERRAIGPISTSTSPRTVFADEFAVARSLLRYSTADVVSCGFAFPTLAALPSIPFTLVMGALAYLANQSPASALKNVVPAVIAPAGNEYVTANPASGYWPAAHKDVVGVGATDVTQTHRAVFSKSHNGTVTSGSNWGTWVDCAARGQHVVSTFIDYSGRLEEDPGPGLTPGPAARFRGWAQWDGTSFATPKVAAKVADRVSAGAPSRFAFTAMMQYLTHMHLVKWTVQVPNQPHAVPRRSLQIG
jgi:hypothetical protein